MTNTVQEGQVLAGKYKVERVLGQGGMGVVVAAIHQQLEQRVALKFLLPEGTADSNTRARFLREARAAVRLKSEHVAKVLDVGALEEGAPYIVMEFLEGRDLEHVLEEQGKLAPAQAIDWLLQACEAIAEAHAAGIVHRDLKPANLFLTTRSDGSPCVKVLDFGISKVETPGSNQMTHTTAMMGTPHYMSPEQLRSPKSVDARADIWALGMILYELLTGQVAYQRETLPVLCAAILTEPVPPPRSLNPAIDPGLEAVILKALEKEASDRYPSLAELAHALAPFCDSGYTAARKIARVLGAMAPRGGEAGDEQRRAPLRPPVPSAALASAATMVPETRAPDTALPDTALPETPLVAMPAASRGLDGKTPREIELDLKETVAPDTIAPETPAPASPSFGSGLTLAVNPREPLRSVPAITARAPRPEPHEEAPVLRRWMLVAGGAVAGLALLLGGRFLLRAEPTPQPASALVGSAPAAVTTPVETAAVAQPALPAVSIASAPPAQPALPQASSPTPPAQAQKKPQATKASPPPAPAKKGMMADFGDRKLARSSARRHLCDPTPLWAGWALAPWLPSCFFSPPPSAPSPPPPIAPPPMCSSTRPRGWPARAASSRPAPSTPRASGSTPASAPCSTWPSATRRPPG